MSQGYGYNAYAGIGEESTYGTPVAATKFFEIESESIKGKPQPRVPARVLGSLSLRRTTRAKTEVGGTMLLPMQWNGVDKLLKHAFGASSVSTSGANPYTHTYSLKAALETGLTLVVNRDAANIGAGSMFQYDGCHIGKLKLSQKESEPLMLEVTFVGRNPNVVNIQAATFPTWDPIEYGTVTIANMDDDGTPTGMKVISFDLEIDNKLEPKFYLTSPASNGVHRIDRRGVTFNAEIEFESLAIWNAYKLQTEHDYRFKWMKDSAVDTVNTLNITMPKAFIEEVEPETGGPGPYRMPLKGVAEFNAADNDELSLILKNTTAGPI